MAQDNDQRQGAPTKMKTGLRVLLIASLALNFLVVGVIGGAMVSSGWRGGPPPHPDRIAGPFTQALKPADRRAIGLALRRAYRADSVGRTSLRQDFGPVIAALQTEPFNPELVEKTLSILRISGVERMQFGQRLLVKRLSEMSIEERRAFTDRLINVIDGAAQRGRYRR